MQYTPAASTIDWRLTHRVTAARLIAGECAVLYCWEVQVEKVAKRRGLGRFLMQLLELLAIR